MSSAALPSSGVAALPLGNGAPVSYGMPVVRAISTAQPHRFTVAQVEEMVKVGILDENDRCELIRGELIEKMTIGDPHVAAVRRLVRFFKRLPDELALLGVQDPIKLADSRPEPDCTLLRPAADDYELRTASPPDILLLIEVADSTLAFDRTIKGPLYAQNGIAEYWIVNLLDQQIEVHRQPRATGRYDETIIVRQPDSVSPLALPQLSLAVQEILGRNE